MSIEVSSPGLIKLRILKANNTDISSMKKQENKIYFNVSDGYVVDTYNCTSGNYTYDNIEDTLTISNAEDNTICNVSYKEGYKKLKDIILGRGLSLDNGLMVTTSTNSGNPTYYYTGQVENNYISIPEKNGETTTNALYRIVRINEDGSVRLVRQSSIGTNPYNPNLYSYKYGYYSESNIIDEASGTKGAMRYLNDWYDATFANTNMNDIIIEGSFCEQPKANYHDLLNVKKEENISTYKPSYKCEKDANGYGPLTLKVGLLNIDEVLFSGMKIDKESDSYLNETGYFWVMTSAGYNGAAMIRTAFKFISLDTTNPKALNYNYMHQIRPVISINADDINIIGNGTIERPFDIILS